ncbi:SDR family NAD(P)-dependent oxidoreductase [Desulfobacula sp.]|uniref:SDR family NAD(P)-dependent oxidoreductase n=1 Tax=Desulfobacula sp. TaxID=2593537 RepID=UPI002620F28E|nr:SDR family NAD(P)-dependent oxidoreductase [Desulfobacula sp.]
MIKLNEFIHVPNALEAAFTYTSDFSNIKDWDPGVAVSQKRSKGGTQVGSTYDLTLRFGPFRPKMKYTITAYIPFSKVILKGRGDSFSAVDTISFFKTPTGTRIDYEAQIFFSGFSKRTEKLLTPVLKNTGRKAIQGLEAKLSGENRIYKQSSWFFSGSTLFDYIADHMILPGMLMFSNLGYSFSKRFWAKNHETLFGQKVVITGGTSGIGKAAAIKLAEKKACLTIIARNRKKAERVRQQIIEKTGNPHVDFLIADLSRMEDIKHVVKKLRDSKKTIDVLINNAGALFNERKETVEGFEQTFATDLLGVFYLTELLKDCFASTGGRIVNVSSGGMYTQGIFVDDLQNKAVPYAGAKAYARAKRGIVILTRLWAQQMHHLNVTVHSMHPGWVDTPGIETALPGFHSLVNSVLRTPDQGADTIVWLAASKEAGESTGRFWLDRRPHETVLFPKTGESEEARQVLWEKLNRLTRPFETA